MATPRFRFDASDGGEGLADDVPALAEAVRTGRLDLHGQLLDSHAQQWILAIDHAIVRTTLAAMDAKPTGTSRSAKGSADESTARAHPELPRLSEAIWLALVPFLGYFYAYSFEVGYAGFFGVPYWLVEVSVAQTFVVVAGLVVLGVTSGSLLSSLRPGPWWVVAGLLLELALPTLAVVVSLRMWNGPPDAPRWIAVVPALALTALLAELHRYVVVPMRRRPDLPLQAIADAMLHRAQQQRLSAFDVMLGTVEAQGLRVRAFILPGYLALAVVPIVLFAAGQKTAGAQTRFLLPEVDPSCVVVRRYGSVTYCAHFADGRMTGVLTTLSDDVRSYERASIGPLRP